MNNKIGLVTMCRKAGKLVMGMDMVKDACNTGKACAVFAATDFSPKSLKEIKFNCYKNGIKLYSLGMTMDDIHFGLGKRTGVIAICEGGFAKACAKGLEEIPIDENEFYSRPLIAARIAAAALATSSFVPFTFNGSAFVTASFKSL